MASESGRLHDPVRGRQRLSPVLHSGEAPPTVSVIIPCYNYGRFLPGAVKSVLDQDRVLVDVIIVDDASPDGSGDIAAALAEGDRRITVVRHSENRGAVETFNDGLPYVTGEFLVRLDADDLLTPGSLRRSLDAARHVPTAGLIYGRPRHFHDEPSESFSSEVRSWYVWPGLDWLAGRCRDGLNVITSPEVVMRSAVVAEVGGQKPLKHTHDMEMWFRIAAFSDVVYVAGPDQAWHRDHPASLSATQVDPISDLAERQLAFETLFDGAASSVPGAAEMLQAARRAVALNAVSNATHAWDRGRATEELIANHLRFAETCDPTVVTTSNWARLQRRLRSGRNRRPWQAWYGIAASARSVAWRLRHRRWLSHGTYHHR